jgi:hypothetical protein
MYSVIGGREPDETRWNLDLRVPGEVGAHREVRDPFRLIEAHADAAFCPRAPSTVGRASPSTMWSASSLRHGAIASQRPGICTRARNPSARYPHDRF